MKFKYLLSCLMAGTILSSCIQDEALNVEAAIDGCSGKDIQLVNIDMEKKEVQLYISKATGFDQIHIEFELPEGASISPDTPLPTDNPPYYDFSKSDHATRKFTVVSEDHKWKSTYRICIWQTELPKQYGFETLSASTPYHVFYEDNSAGNIICRLQWCSGNPGYQLTGMGTNPLNYPTVQHKGGANNTMYCVKLETRDNGSFGNMVKMPLAAGNLFIGSFDLANAMTNAKAATKFGYTFYEEPAMLSGWYKYTPGPVYINKDRKEIKGKTDACDIYAVLYETNEQFQTLDGTNSLTSKHIISMARNPEAVKPAEQWTHFELPFVLKPGKKIDPEKLHKGVYKIALVFSSSVEGADFNGAIGSTLYVDEVSITTKKPGTDKQP